jgi:Tfp pilus assembly protein PilN
MIVKPNLLPEKYRIIRPVSLKRVVLVSLILALFMAGGYAYYLFRQDIKGLEEQRESLKEALSQLSPTEERIRAILEKQKEIEHIKNLNGTVKAGYQDLSQVLTDVARVMPASLSFRAVQYSESALTIRGTAADSLTVAEYGVSLRGLAGLAAVEIKQVERIDTGVDFIISATLASEGGEGDVQETSPAEPAS